MESRVWFPVMEIMFRALSLKGESVAAVRAWRCTLCFAPHHSGQRRRQRPVIGLALTESEQKVSNIPLAGQLLANRTQLLATRTQLLATRTQPV